MNRRITLLLVTLISISASAQNLPKVTTGTISRIENFHSEFVDSRNIDVWLPEGYDGHKKFDVLYMHDGQMLYDSTTTWNKRSWNVDVVVGKLLKEGKIRNLIIVGVWNGGASRHPDYFPQKPFESLAQDQILSLSKQLKASGRTEQVFQPKSDNYLKFLVKELKPVIDKKYSVKKGRSHTFIAGSSMGGLISMYAICEYPKVFGGAACMSTHWPGTFTMDNNPIPGAFVAYLKNHLPDPKTHKIYFDYGDKTLDAMYPSLQKKVDAVMMAKGFTEKSWKTQFFPGKDHSENAWNERFNIPIEFLLGK